MKKIVRSGILKASILALIFLLSLSAPCLAKVVFEDSVSTVHQDKTVSEGTLVDTEEGKGWQSTLLSNLKLPEMGGRKTASIEYNIESLKNALLPEGAIELLFKKTKSVQEFGYETLFEFLRSDNSSAVAFYMIWNAAGTWGINGSIIDMYGPDYKSNLWGRKAVLGRLVRDGELFSLIVTWGPGKNRVYVNGVEVPAYVGVGGVPANRSGDFSSLLNDVNRIRIGIASEQGNFYPGGYNPLKSGAFVKVRLFDSADVASLALIGKPSITALTDDTFSVPGISGKLVAGDTVHVTLVAEPGGTATFDMGNVTGIPMTESASTPGTYEGSYRVQSGDNFENGHIVGQFKNVSGVSAVAVTSPNKWTIDTSTTLALDIEKTDLPSDRVSKSKIKVKVVDANGDPVKGHHVRVDLATTEEYTGLVGTGDFGENVGAEVEPAWKSVTDSWGEVDFDYRSGFAAKTVIVTAKDLDTGNVGVGYITSYVDALIDIALTRPVSRAATRRGILYYMEVKASRTELTADGRSRSVIRAYVYDPQGKPVEGDTVAFSIDQENGTIRTIKGVTDKNGKATAEYRAGKKVGIVQVTALDTTRGMSGYVSITLLADAPAKIYLAARPDSIPADGFSRSDIEVKVTDINENPNKDVTVLFSLVKGSGKLRYDERVTDRFGETANTFTSGKEPGIATVKATVKSKIPSDQEINRAKFVLFAPYNAASREMKITKWLVKKDDVVKEGEPVAEYRVGRDSFTLRAPYDLQVQEIVAERWDRIDIGQTLAVVSPVELR